MRSCFYLPQSFSAIGQSWQRKMACVLLLGIAQHSPAKLPQGFVIDEALHIWPVEIAADTPSRNYGLMNRFWLPFWQGMLFLFPQPQESAFWMKNTRIALDIRFYSAETEALARYYNAQPCLADPCPTYPSFGKTAYVLETRPHSWIKGKVAPLYLPANVQIR